MKAARLRRDEWYELSEASGHLRYEEFDPDPDGDDGRTLAGSGPFDPCKASNQQHAVSFCRYRKGDHLWVRETWMPFTEAGTSTGATIYRATDSPEPDGDRPLRWRPSIFMPRALSRLTLEVADIRVERLQEISFPDIRAEGFERCSVHPTPHTCCTYLRNEFGSGWDKLNAKRGYSWNSNPWVWVIEFQKV